MCCVLVHLSFLAMGVYALAGGRFYVTQTWVVRGRPARVVGAAFLAAAAWGMVQGVLEWSSLLPRSVWVAAPPGDWPPLDSTLAWLLAPVALRFGPNLAALLVACVAAWLYAEKEPASPKAAVSVEADYASRFSPRQPTSPSEQVRPADEGLTE